MWDLTSIKIKYKLPKNSLWWKDARHFWRIAIVTGVLPDKGKDSETKRSDSDI